MVCPSSFRTNLARVSWVAKGRPNDLFDAGGKESVHVVVHSTTPLSRVLVAAKFEPYSAISSPADSRRQTQ
jgi:hypothetical protein